MILLSTPPDLTTKNRAKRRGERGRAKKRKQKWLRALRLGVNTIQLRRSVRINYPQNWRILNVWKKLRIKTWSRPKSLVKIWCYLSLEGWYYAHVMYRFEVTACLGADFMTSKSALLPSKNSLDPHGGVNHESLVMSTFYITINGHKEIFWAFRRLQHPTNSTELTSFWTNHL